MILGYSRTFAAAGPPLTNLTAQWDASDGTKVWQTLLAANPCWSTAGADGQLCRVWQSTVPGAGVETPFVIEGGGVEPTYRIGSSPMPLPSLHFVDSDGDRMWIRQRDNTSFSPLTQYLGLSAKTILIALQVHASAPGVGYILQVAASNGFGIVLYKPSGDVIQFFNSRSGGTDWNDHTISLNTNYVLMMRHDGVNLISSINGGTESSVASGASTGASDTARLASNGALHTNMSVGEILFYNACLTGADLAAAISYMVSKWT